MTTIRTGVIWLLAAMLGWLVVLTPELVDAGAGSPWARAAYAFQLSGAAALLASAPLAVLHLLLAGAQRLGAPPLASTIAGAGAVLAYPAWQQAVFLTSGDAIARSAWQLPVRVTILLAGMLVGLVLWWWHVTCARAVPEGVSPGARCRSWGGWLAGLWALLVLYYVLHYELRTYAYFARSLAVVAWLVAGTVAYRVLRTVAAPIAVILVLGALASVVASTRLGAADLEAERNALLREGQLVALTDLLVHKRNTAAASYDLSLAHAYDCPPPAAARPSPPLAIPANRRRNVILVSFDALRSDVLGYRRARHGQAAERASLVMPNLANFAARSMNYARAVTTYPATLMAVGGALTGLSASDILFARDRPPNVFARTRERFDRQFAALPSSKWFSLPIIEALFLQGTPVARYANARSQTSWTISQLTKARRETKSVFGWVHYFEPHKPYRQHRAYDYGKGAKPRYLSELAFVDREFGRLLRHLERHGWFEDSLVVVFSDHGQALGERHYYGHHVYLNSWITDIPLLVRAPGQEPGRSLELVDITDIAPTILDFAGAPYAPDSLAGRSLMRPLGGPNGGDRVTFAEAFPVRGRQLFSLTNQPVTSLEGLARRVDLIHRGARNYLPKVAAISAEHRLIVNRVTGATELYDRGRDPDETYDLSQRDVETVARLSDALRRFTRRQSQRIYCGVKRGAPVRPAAIPPSQP